MNPRSARYLRRSAKSTKPGESTSVEDQRTRTTALEVSAGYTNVLEFVDDGVSAWREDVAREDFELLCAAVQAGELDVVVADAPDRISRGGGVAYLTFRALCAASGVRIHTVSNGLDDPTDDNAEIPAFLQGWAAKKESADKSRRLRQRSTERAAAGAVRHAGPRPFGYGDDRLSLHVEEAALLRAAADRVLKGGSLAGVLRAWNDAGVRTSRGGHWSMSGLKAVLSRPRNAGLVVLRGDVLEGVQGSWEPLWDLPTHKDLCALLSASRGSGQPARAHLLSGLLECHCGAPMRAANAGAGMAVYRCTVQTQRLPKGGLEHCTIKRAEVDELVVKELMSVLLLSAPADLPENPETLRLGALYASLSAVQQGVGALVEAVVSGALKGSDVAGRRAELEAEEMRLEGEIELLRKSHASAALITELHRDLFKGGKVSFKDAAAVKKNLKKNFEALPLEDKRSLVRSYLSVKVSPGRGIGRVEVLDRTKE